MEREKQNLVDIKRKIMNIQHLEKILIELGQEGRLKFPLTNLVSRKRAENFPTDIGERIWTKVKARNELYARLKEAQKEIPAERYNFSAFLKAILSKAGISLKEVSQILKVKPNDLRAIEKGQINPLRLCEESVASLMEIFSISTSLLQKILKKRTHNKIVNDNETSKCLIEKVEKILKGRGREDLVTDFHDREASFPNSALQA